LRSCPRRFWRCHRKRVPVAPERDAVGPERDPVDANSNCDRDEADAAGEIRAVAAPTRTLPREFRTLSQGELTLPAKSWRWRAATRSGPRVFNAGAGRADASREFSTLARCVRPLPAKSWGWRAARGRGAKIPDVRSCSHCEGPLRQAQGRLGLKQSRRFRAGTGESKYQCAARGPCRAARVPWPRNLDAGGVQSLRGRWAPEAIPPLGIGPGSRRPPLAMTGGIVAQFQRNVENVALGGYTECPPRSCRQSHEEPRCEKARMSF